MKKIVIASTRKNAGKTSLIVGLSKALNKKIGYIKPFGDRLLYKKKTLWDYDSALLTNVFQLEQEPKDITMGFEHSKLRYVFDEAGTRQKLREMVANSGQDKEILFVEGGKDLSYGMSVNLDPISITKDIGGKLVLVACGNENAIMDDITLFHKYMDITGVDFAGVIFNKVHDPADFKETFLSGIVSMGINVLGILPYKTELNYFSVAYLAENLFAKVITGESALDNVVENILVGAMTFDALLRSSILEKKKHKLLITSGERSDIILAALESDTAGIILTNNTLPHSNIISKAQDSNIPILLVAADTYQVAKQIDSMVPLWTHKSSGKIDLMTHLVKENLKLDDLM